MKYKIIIASDEPISFSHSKGLINVYCFGKRVVIRHTEQEPMQKVLAICCANCINGNKTPGVIPCMNCVGYSRYKQKTEVTQ